MQAKQRPGDLVLRPLLQPLAKKRPVSLAEGARAFSQSPGYLVRLHSELLFTARARYGSGTTEDSATTFPFGPSTRAINRFPFAK
jgi:hypothetical protein